MPYTTDRSTQVVGLALALGAVFTIHGTMLWGFDGVAAQAAATCAADNTKTAISRPANLKQPEPGTMGTAAKSSAPV